MPPLQRRSDRTQAAASSDNRSRMYNLAGHAHSSGSLLPRSTDVHAASTSAAHASPTTPGRGVDASEAPYLTNLESHFGRVTLIAPDNMLRKQAKERKQKVRQRKAQNAQAAAEALAGVTQNAFTSSVGRNAAASTSNLLDPGRRYQATMGDASATVSTGLLLAPPGQLAGQRRAYSGNQTPTLASTSHLQTPSPSTSQQVVARTRRRRPSAAAQGDSSRPASRASGPSRPESALSFNEDETAQAQVSVGPGDRPPRSRTESAPASQQPRRSDHARAFATAPDQSSSAVPQTSLHRQNVWNDITEADPDDLPPPFPEGAPRPRTPPLPPAHSEAANDAQLIGPQPHARIPDSPPPPFVSDDEDEPSATGHATEQSIPTPAAESRSRPSSRASTPSSASENEDESVAATEERRAWEADIRNGLSFEVRMLREQQRRVARERAAALEATRQEIALSEPRPAESGNVTTTIDAPAATTSASTASTEAAPSTTAEAVSQPTSESVAAEARTGTVTHDTALASPIAASYQGQDESSVAAAETAPRAPKPTGSAQPALTAAEPARSEASAVPTPATVEEPQSDVDRAEIPTLSTAQPQQPTIEASDASRPNPSIRPPLFNETRLGLPAMPTASSAPRRVSTHRKTNSDTHAPAPLQRITQGAQANTLSGGSDIRNSVSSLQNRHQGVRGHDSDSNLPLSRRPEDTLYVISAPPPRTSLEADASTSQTNLANADELSDASVDDDGAESDSSIEQWLAESAAFDALRKREEEAAARLQTLRAPVLDDSDEDDEAIMPGAFTHAPTARQRGLNEKVPNPANLAALNSVLPKAPPPLVLGRSRGGAAYSDSSSESTDTDDALDLYSESDEDDLQHRVFHEARSGKVRVSEEPFAGSHRSVHVRNTSSAPNLAIVDPSTEQKEANGTPAPAVPSRASDTELEGVRRSLSLKAKGKLPERPATDRAGEFQEDTSSSRDVSYDDEPAPVIPPSAPPPHRASSASLPQPGSSLPGVQSNVRRQSIDPLLQPLGYGKRPGPTYLGDRLKGLFGQSLLPSNAEEEQAHAQAASATTDARRSLHEPRRRSGHTISAEDVLAAVDNAGKAEAATTAAQPSSIRRQLSAGSRRISNRSVNSQDTERLSHAAHAEPTHKREASSLRAQQSAGSRLASTRTFNEGEILAAVDNAGKAEDSRPAEQSTVRRQSSATSRRASDRSLKAHVAPSQTGERVAPKASEADSATPAGTSAEAPAEAASTLHRQLSSGSKPTAGPKATSSASSVLPEQQARDEALAQIAQLSATSQRQDSLAALERLLAKTGRPTSTLPLPKAALSRAELGGHLQPPTSDVDAADSADQRPAASSNRLSRQGAIVRNRPPLPAPPSALSRAASTNRPVSFVNPRSSAAPLPRGRLPAITDATRHFPPSANASAGPGVVPSWLSYIPSEERDRLPAPLLPQRLNAPPGSGSRVAAMVSRFEASQEQQIAGRSSSSSPTKLDAPSTTAEGVDGTNEGEPSVSSRFPPADATNENRFLQRRPPPPPPVLPSRRPDPPIRTSSSAASIESLTQQIEDAAYSWSHPSLHPNPRPASQLPVPASSGGTASSSGALPLTPRTQAMETLTRREHLDPNATTPPMLPPRSPLMTPEQILAGGSRNGLSASIAAAQAAAFARRGGSHSASNSWDAKWARNDAAENGEGSSPRPLPRLPDSVRSIGLGIGGDEEDAEVRGGDSPVPPPLPTRPRERNWAEIRSPPSTVRSPQRIVDSSSSATRTLAVASPSSATSPPTVVTPISPMRPPAVTSPDAATGAQGASSPASARPARVDSPRALPNIPSRSDPPSRSTSSTNLTSPAAEAGPSTAPADSQLATDPRPPRREASLGLTDFDLLVASLERPDAHQYEHLSAIGEFLGPAKPTAATPEQLDSLSVGLIECDSRRVTKEGKIKQKLSCVGVRVDKCTICMAQFREGQRAVILPKCGHIFHEDCATQLLRRVTSCPTCRTSAF